jgi:hypothetical protein
MNREEKIKRISLIILISFLISVLYHWILGASSFSLSFPYNTFLTSKAMRFSDFTNVYDCVRSLDPYVSYERYTHLPIMPIILYPITLFSLNTALIILLVSFIIYHVLYVYGHLKGEDENYLYIIIISFLTFPFMFTFDRANPEILTYIVITVFFYYYQRKQYTISSLLLGVAIAMKLFPAALIILFIYRKQYKQIIYAVLTSIILNCTSLLLFESGMSKSLNALMSNLSFYQLHYVQYYSGLWWSHSLWGLFKVAYHGVSELIFDNPGFSGLKYFTKPYIAFVLILFGLVSYYTIYKEEIFWRKIALIIFVMNLFPFCSGGYKMMYVYIPLLFFVNSEPGKKDMLYCLLFALLMIPKHYLPLPWMPPYSISGEPEDLWAFSEIVIDPLLMLIFAGVIIWDGIKVQKVKLSTIINKVSG